MQSFDATPRENAAGEGPPPPSILRVVPRQRRAAATVQRILMAALTVLRRTPAPERDGLSLEEIAREAGTSIPAVYRYFSCVDDILIALVQHEQTRILQQGIKLLEERQVGSDIEIAGTLVDFFIHVFNQLLENRTPVLYLLRGYHEVAYGAFNAAAPQIRIIMDRAGLLQDRQLEDVQLVTALSTLASAVKAVILREETHLSDPAFRDRMVRMMLGIMATPRAN